MAIVTTGTCRLSPKTGVPDMRRPAREAKGQTTIHPRPPRTVAPIDIAGLPSHRCLRPQTTGEQLCTAWRNSSSDYSY